MKLKVLSILIVLLTVTSIVLYRCWSNDVGSAQLDMTSRPVAKDYPDNKELTQSVYSQPSETISAHELNAIEKLTQELRSDDPTTSRKAKDAILEKARFTPNGRKFVIAQLLRELARYTDFDQVRLQEDRTPWESMVDILGALRAVEALPYLVERLDWGVYYSDSHSGRRAFQAVVKLGEDAVPALSASVFDPSPQIRFYSVRALLSIESDNAIRALRSALEVETDPDIRGVISDGLAAIYRK